MIGVSNLVRYDPSKLSFIVHKVNETCIKVDIAAGCGKGIDGVRIVDHVERSIKVFGVRDFTGIEDVGLDLLKIIVNGFVALLGKDRILSEIFQDFTLCVRANLFVETNRRKSRLGDSRCGHQGNADADQ